MCCCSFFDFLFYTLLFLFLAFVVFETLQCQSKIIKIKRNFRIHLGAQKIVEIQYANWSSRFSIDAAEMTRLSQFFCLLKLFRMPFGCHLLPSPCPIFQWLCLISSWATHKKRHHNKIDLKYISMASFTVSATLFLLQWVVVLVRLVFAKKNS